MLLNSQFILFFWMAFFFSVRFCDNSLLVLKMRFQVFCFTSRNVQGFSNDKKILMSLLSVLFHLQSHVSVFWNFNFWQRYLGKLSLCPWKQPHFLRNSYKSLSRGFPEPFLSFVNKRQLKTIMPTKTFP